MKPRSIVIGGGASGTAAALTLNKAGHDVTIIEKEARLGGRIFSRPDIGNVELGAGFLTSRYKNVLAFLSEHGLDDRLVARKSQAALVKNGTEHPASIKKLLIGNELLSAGARTEFVRTVCKELYPYARLDMYHPWRAFPDGGRSIGRLNDTEYGRELIDYLWQPIFDGYCYYDVREISEALLTVFFKIIPAQKFVIEGGLMQITEAAAKGSHVLLNCQVQSVVKSPKGYDITYAAGHTTKTIVADNIVCATPASVVPKVFKQLRPEQRTFFTSVGYSSAVVLARVYDIDGITLNKAIAYPRIEHSGLAAVTIASDDSYTTVKSYASGDTSLALCQRSDDAIREALSPGIPPEFRKRKPKVEYIQRWPEAIPEFTPTHVRKLGLIAKGDTGIDEEHLVFTGDYLTGPYIEAAFTHGIISADKLLGRT